MAGHYPESWDNWSFVNRGKFLCDLQCMIQEHILNSLTLNNKAAFRIQGARVKNQMHSMKPLTMRLLVNIYFTWPLCYVQFNQLHETRRQIRIWWHMNRSVQQSYYAHLSFSWQLLPELDKLLVIRKRITSVGANFQAFELYLHNENIISSTFIASNSIHA